MKLDDIFFAIGIILISSLLVYVIYDDITNPYPMNMTDALENNTNGTINITQKDTELVPSSAVNNSINTKFNIKTLSENTQSSNGDISTQNVYSRTNTVQNLNSPNNNQNNNKDAYHKENNIKTYNGDLKPSSFSNNPNNNRQIGQIQPRI
ncbi:MAG: hypothetical protein E7Z86_08310 [Methanosphaera stadtmanae]|jgi:hypothetical protein|nr:hypothetical protein [Methanosphaera stadtmanae]